MTTLSKRSTPSQAKVFRIIEGAIYDAINGHPNWIIDKRFIKSVSKRAVGTLTSQWPEVLATSHATEVKIKITQRPDWRAGERRRALSALRQLPEPRYMKAIRNMIGYEAGEARRVGNIEREKAFVEVLKLMDQQQNGK
jgi:hypothetical protein